MRIDRIRLHSVKRHADLDISLSPGLTVVRGPNEAGKSTIQQALELALFRRCTSSAQDMADVRRWGADEDPVVELDIADEGRRGSVRKVFAGARGTVELVWDGVTLTDPAAVDARLVDLSGIASEKFFRSTASIRHHELADLDRDEGALRDRLQQSISGADQGTWAARRKLDDALRRYRAEGVRNPGPLKSTRDRIGALERQAADGERGLARLQADRQALSMARSARTALDAQLARERRGLAASERAVSVAASLGDVSARYQRYRRAAELREAIESAERSLPGTAALESLRAGVDSVRSLERAISQLRAGLAAEPVVMPPGEPHAAPQGAPRTGPLVSLGLGGTAGGIAVALLGPLVGLAQLMALGAGVVLVVGGMAALLLARRRRRVALGIRLRDSLLSDEIVRRQSDRTGRAAELQEAERRRDEALAGLAMPDLASAEAALATHTAQLQAIERLEAEYRGLMGDGPREEQLAATRDRLAAEADEMRHALAGMDGGVGEAPERARQRHEAAVQDTTARREAALAAEADARARVDATPVDAEEVAAVVESLEAARTELAGIERRVRIYTLTLAALDTAEQATMKKVARYLEERMGVDVARITGGRYSRIAVDENELTFRVWAPERGDWVDVRRLSQGTLDQLYLAARLALVRQVTRDRHPPLIFDDPFLTFDDARAREALGLLKEMAADHQVIYLTTSGRYDAIADRVVELAGPSARDPGAARTRPVEAAVVRRPGAATVPGQMSLLGPDGPDDEDGTAARDVPQGPVPRERI